MITCLGLIVGSVESANTIDILRQCGVFFKKNKHLQNIPHLTFKVNNQPYCVIVDFVTSLTNDNNIDILFEVNEMWQAITV